jgi:ParB family transcriptional regulator, chromosome partitioning protein
VAKAVGRSRAAVTNLMRLNLLSDIAKGYLRKDQISMGHARALLTLEHDEQMEACEHIVTKQLSVRETEALVRKLLFSTNEKQAVGRNLVHDPQLEKWSDFIASRFRSDVSIKMSANGSCSMTIKTKSKEVLEKIICEFEG